MKNFKVGDRVRFIHPHPIFESLFGLVGIIVSYNKHGWASHEDKHSVTVEFDNGKSVVGEVAMFEREG